MPAGFSEADKARLTRAYRDAIQRQILAAYRGLVSFIRQEYLPRCRDTVGLSALPNGKQWYDYWVRFYTTTTLTTEQIFELGNAEVARITREMDALKTKTGFAGNLAAFAKNLDQTTATYRTKNDLIQANARLRTVVEPNLPTLFGHLPKGTFEIRPVEEFRDRTSQSQLIHGVPVLAPNFISPDAR